MGIKIDRPSLCDATLTTPGANEGNSKYLVSVLAAKFTLQGLHHLALIVVPHRGIYGGQPK
jgi:hypothetical protein